MTEEPEQFHVEPPPRKRQSMGAEWKLQTSAVHWLRKMQRYDAWFRDHVRFFAPMAESQRTMKRAAVAKSMGMTAGVADLIAIIRDPKPGKEYTLLWVEFKRPGDKLSEAQDIWFEWLKDTRVQAHLITDLDTFIRLLNYFKGPSV